MNHWNETAGIAARLAECKVAGRRAAIATVVRIAGSAYRRPGAKLLIEEGGAGLGSVSGGCLEADVREVALSVLETGTPRLRHYDTRAHEDIVWGLGLGCNGMVDVLVQPATEGPFAQQCEGLREWLAGDRSFTIATIVEGAGSGEVLLLDASRALGSLGSAELDREAARFARSSSQADSELHSFWESRVFLDRLAPPPELIVCGAGDDAVPLAAYAAEAGFRVRVIDHRPALLGSERFPRAVSLLRARPEDTQIDLPSAARSMAVVKTHSLAHDREWARRWLAAGVPYVGLLGPRRRAETIVREIGAEADERVFGPVGLDLGAYGPHQIAISIVAELLAVIARREPRHLSQRTEAIHAG